ncbi:hypothetical protein HMPREF1547_00827 [Blautia sp. KLE 1732]|nr:hypothetical protein HMPREF1547_00827 [Blautia sp. KLE 1732]
MLSKSEFSLWNSHKLQVDFRIYGFYMLAFCQKHGIIKQSNMHGDV